VVSPWMPDGDLLQYLQKIPGANRAEIVRVHVGRAKSILNLISKMIGIAEGLSYLHFNDVVHGDMKGVSNSD
jgi:serine/threonine protein kinase